MFLNVRAFCLHVCLSTTSAAPLLLLELQLQQLGVTMWELGRNPSALEEQPVL